MKAFAKGLLLPLVFLAAPFPFAQTVNHVIVVMMENRTPDNLFGSDLHNPNGRQLPNAHLAPNGSGACYDPNTQTTAQIPLTPFVLDPCFDPNHTHSAWTTTWDHITGNGHGTMDEACQITVNYGKHAANCQNQVGACSDSNVQYCPEYTYVDNSAGILVPYFNVAINYGYANYMFQTNQGPSFPAHQFLFSGTSAPDLKSYPDGYYQWFAAENPVLSDGHSTPLVGCAAAPAGSIVFELDPTVGDPEAPGYTPEPIYPGDTAGYPCYTHPTMASLLKSNNLTWKYYTDSPNDESIPAGASIWTAPNAITDICNPVVHSQCTGGDWANVIIPGDSNYGGYATPILWDLGDNNQGYCGLPPVSWVVPDGDWSDHAGSGAGSDGGPSFVAAIINGVGGVNNDGSAFPMQCHYWGDTVVLITWDDWGGFYDDVDPNPTGQNGGYSNGTGQQYVYGFRVPLLVVSKYAIPGYVSGPANNATCVHILPRLWQHSELYRA